LARPGPLLLEVQTMTDRSLLLGRRRLVAGAVLLPGTAAAQSLLGGAQPPGARPLAPAAPVPGAPVPGAPVPGALAPAGAGQAVITVDRAQAEPIPIAFPPFTGSELGGQIAEVASADLQRSGLFRPIDQAAYGGAADPSAVPNFQNWKALGAQALVTGQAMDQGGQVRVEFRLWDVLPGQQLVGTAFTADSGTWRRIAHKIADAIYQRLLGDKGYFDTRVVYVAQSGPKGRRTTRLAIMDQDGANTRFLTSGDVTVLTPRFAPNSNEIAFMSYAGNRPRVYLFNLGSGSQRVLGDFGGMTLSPRFSPDGGSVLLAETRGAGSSIYSVSLGGGRTQLTDGSSIDVSPCYSPDGSQIVFNSDRGGDQQLYVMGAGGGGVRRISFGSGRYASPVWSPRGDLIAYVRFGSGNFSLGVMHPDGTGERIIAESWYLDGPTFCPNGRVLMYYTQTASGRSGQGFSSSISAVDVTGFNDRRVMTPTDASDPAWGPLLT
jgi:TolB protein